MKLDSVIAGRGAAQHLPLIAFAFCLSFVTSCFNTYLLLYIVRSDVVTLSLAGGMLVLAGGVGIASRIWAASLADRGSDEKIYRYLFVFALGGAGACALLSESQLLEFLWLPVVLLYGLCLFGWGGALAVALVRFGAGKTGRVTGRVYAGFYAGLSLGPVLFGSFLLPRWGYSAAWWICAGVATVAALCVLPTSVPPDWQTRADVRTHCS
jgi:predicted MFS family arabinose efflux permease